MLSPRALHPRALQLRVGVDVSSQCHSVAVGLTDGSLLEAFEIFHTAAGFGVFFARIEGHATPSTIPIRLPWPWKATTATSGRSTAW